MSTKSNLDRSEIGIGSPKLYNRIRTTIETAFYRNNVVKITSLTQAYELAKNYVDEVRNKVQSEIVLVAFDVNKSKKFLNKDL